MRCHQRNGLASFYVLLCLFLWSAIVWAADEEDGIKVRNNSRRRGCGAFILDLTEGLTDANSGMVRVENIEAIRHYLTRISLGAADMLDVVLDAADAQAQSRRINRSEIGILEHTIATLETAEGKKILLCFLSKKCALPGEKYILFPLVFADPLPTMLFDANGGFRPYVPRGISVRKVPVQPLFFSDEPSGEQGDLEVVLSFFEELSRFTAWIDLVRIAHLAEKGAPIDRTIRNFLTLSKTEGSSWDPGFVYAVGTLRAMLIKRIIIGELGSRVLFIHWDEGKEYEGETVAKFSTLPDIEKTQRTFGKEALSLIEAALPRTEKVRRELNLVDGQGRRLDPVAPAVVLEKRIGDSLRASIRPKRSRLGE